MGKPWREAEKWLKESQDWYVRVGGFVGKLFEAWKLFGPNLI